MIASCFPILRLPLKKKKIFICKFRILGSSADVAKNGEEKGSTVQQDSFTPLNCLT